MPYKNDKAKMHGKSLAGAMLIYLLLLTKVCSNFEKTGFIIQLSFYYFSGN